MSMACAESTDLPLCGRKGKTCSMTGCQNTHLRCPNMSFFRFPKESARSIEWLNICQRPDLLSRMAIKDININNYYVCEIHFPNQILDYATRKILIKTAKPLSLVELNALPPHERFVKAAIPMRIPRRRQTINYSYDHEYDDDNDDDHSENTFDPEVIIAKTEENYHNGDLLEPLAGHDDDSYADDPSKQWWTPEATRVLIRLRIERDAEFDQPNARKSQLWCEIANEMRKAGYDFTVDKVSKKWHNMTITYHKNCDRPNGRINWEFYDDLDPFYRNKKMSDPAMDYEESEPKQRKLGDSLQIRRIRRVQNEQSPSNRESNAGTSTRPIPREIKRKASSTDENDCFEIPDTGASIDGNWWKSYFDKKLDLERERIQKEDERHKDRINFQKMALMLQERVEKIKVEAMNNLTNALLKLQDVSKH